MNRWTRLCFLLAALLACTMPQPAAAKSSCSLSNNSHRLALKNMHTVGGIRVFYDIVGEHRIPNLSDQNKNQIPDLVEDIALHAAVSRGVFNVVGFRDPLLSGRFSASDHIDIELVNFGLYRPKASENRGFAFSGQYQTTQSSLRGDGCSLMIVLNVAAPKFSILAKDFLIPHEMFHLYQYAYSEFKQAWLLEGLAKWAERATQNRDTFDRVSRGHTLPASPAAFMQEVVRNANPYATQRFWASLLNSENFPADRCKIPSEWLTLTFSDGSPVIRSSEWHGCATVQNMLTRLEQRSEQISKASGRTQFQWTEDQRRRDACNLVVIQALRLAIEPTASVTRVARVLSMLESQPAEQAGFDVTAGAC